MQACKSAYGTESQGNLYPKGENPIFNFCMGKAFVLPVSGGVGMYTCLYGPKIIAGRQYHGIDTVHNSFIVGDGPKRFYVGNGDRTYHFFRKFRRGHGGVLVQVAYRAAYLRPYQTIGYVVGEDAHYYLY